MIASEGQANGLHLGAKLYRAIQANQRNVIDTVCYYLLNPELLVTHTGFSAIFACVSILVVVSHPHCSRCSADKTIVLWYELNCIAFYVTYNTSRVLVIKDTQ